MIHGQDNKIVLVTPPAAILDNTAITTAVIDTKGFDYAEVYVLIGAIDIPMAVLKLQESDLAGSGFADVTDAAFTGTGLPQATDDNTVYGFHVDLRGKKRYLDVVATAGDGAAGAFITIIALLSRPKQSPANAAARGLKAEVIV